VSDPKGESMADAAHSEIEPFLARHQPFSALDAAHLKAICEAAGLREFPSGHAALVEDGPPAKELGVVFAGSMELVHQGEVIDVLEPGEAFGHTSLLTGMAPTFTVRAQVDSVCIMLGPEAALGALGRPEGVRWMALADRNRLTRTGHTVHGLPQIDTTLVGSLVLRPPLFCEPQTSIREGAQLLGERADTALLLETSAGLGIVTDAEIRERVVAGAVPVDAPLAEIARVPVPSVAADTLAIDATIDMLGAGADHLVVIGDGHRPIGVISASDLAGLDTHSPFALRHAILSAGNEDAVAEAALKARDVFRWLFDAGLSSTSLGRVLTLQIDAITSRLLNLSIARHGQAPASWAWLALGSGARREFTLGSDQDNALAYGDTDADVDGYFARLGAEVNDGLRRCGFEADTNGVLAGSPRWRMSQSAWVATFADCLTSPDNSRLIRATVAFDFRQSAGPLQVTPPLVTQIQRAAEHPAFVRQLGRVSASYKPPLSFRGQIAAGADGRVDVKRGGIIPIVNVARFYALTNGITISMTVERLRAARETGAIEPNVAEELLESFEIISRLRLGHHAQCVDAHAPIDDLIDLGTLTPIQRRELRDVFRAISRAQRRLSVYLPAGV
jgi:CBS domain-containing protein